MLSNQIIWNWMMKMSIVNMKPSPIVHYELQTKHASVWRDVQDLLFDDFTEPLFRVFVDQHSVSIELGIRVSHLSLKDL